MKQSNPSDPDSFYPYIILLIFTTKFSKPSLEIMCPIFESMPLFIHPQLCEEDQNCIANEPLNLWIRRPPFNSLCKSYNKILLVPLKKRENMVPKSIFLH